MTIERGSIKIVVPDGTPVEVKPDGTIVIGSPFLPLLPLSSSSNETLLPKEGFQA